MVPTASPSTPAPVRGTRGPLFWGALGLLWAVIVVAGLAALAAYDNRPGAAADAPARWPAASRLPRDPHRPTLVMLAHPRCSCTQASLAELAEVLARAPERAQVYVVFIRPTRVAGDGDWDRTGLRRAAEAIPGVTVVRDDDGREAALFQARTSGQTLLYAPDGRLLFSGGTTGARGHAGDNAGRATLVSILADRQTPRPATPVYGCSLFGPADRPLSDGETAHADHAH
jgi:hypothetical protein